jgi:endoglucanase
MEAGRLWRNTRYEKLGAVMASRIAQQEVALVPNLGPMLLPGPQGFHPDPNTFLVNPSYLPPFLLQHFARSSATHSGPWGSILQSLQTLLAQGSSAGYAMDWVVAGNAGVHPSVTPMQFAQQTKDVSPIGSYDAIRVYLWLGIEDEGTPGRRAMLASTSGMANYLKNQVTPPLQVDGTGKVLNPDGPAGFSAAVAPYLDAVGMKTQEKAQLDRLSATKDPATGLYGHGAEYYDQNLALFAIGWSENFYRFDRDGTLKVKWK